MSNNFIKLWKKRGLPNSLEGFRAIKGSYSQFGEDAILASIFDREHSRGLYLDLGCYHPIIWSNTFHFYTRGWKGMSVDASQRHTALWQRYRPRDQHLCRPILPSPKHRLVAFIENTGHPATSHCQVTSADGLDQHSPLSQPPLFITEFAQWWSFDEPPDLVSIDLEGLDVEICLNFPFEKFTPKALVFESSLRLADIHPLVLQLVSLGYVLAGMTGPSFIWVHDPRLAVTS
jgi:hypothetical protein